MKGLDTGLRPPIRLLVRFLIATHHCSCSDYLLDIVMRDSALILLLQETQALLNRSCKHIGAMREARLDTDRTIISSQQQLTETYDLLQQFSQKVHRSR